MCYQTIRCRVCFKELLEQHFCSVKLSAPNLLDNFARCEGTAGPQSSCGWDVPTQDIILMQLRGELENYNWRVLQRGVVGLQEIYKSVIGSRRTTSGGTRNWIQHRPVHVVREENP